jgi:hypothetical protein
VFFSPNLNTGLELCCFTVTVLGGFYEIKISYVETPPARLPAGDLESAIADFHEIWYRQGVLNKKVMSEFSENRRCECRIVLRGVSEMLALFYTFFARFGWNLVQDMFAEVCEKSVR